MTKHNKNNSMSNYMNYNYNYNLRLIPKNKPINNFDPKALKKLKNSNILNFPLNNDGPIKLKNKDSNNNSLSKLLIKPRTPDLDNNINHQNQIYNFSKNNNFIRHNSNFNNIYNRNHNHNQNLKRPSTAPQKGKGLKNMRNYSFENRKKNMNNYNNQNYSDNHIYNLYNTNFNKRMPSPMIKHQKQFINSKHIQPTRYRAPSPMISPSLGMTNFIKKIIK